MTDSTAGAVAVRTVSLYTVNGLVARPSEQNLRAIAALVDRSDRALQHCLSHGTLFVTEAVRGVFATLSTVVGLVFGEALPDSFSRLCESVATMDMVAAEDVHVGMKALRDALEMGPK